MTQFGVLVVSGLIIATADGTSGKLFTQTIRFVVSSPHKHPPIVDSDFERLTPIRVTNNAEIGLFAANDFIALKYNDRVLLTFSPDNTALITTHGEYVRDSATVKIIDNDCKFIHV